MAKAWKLINEALSKKYTHTHTHTHNLRRAQIGRAGTTRSSPQSAEKRALEQRAKTAEERLAILGRQLASSSEKAMVPTTDATKAPKRRLGPEAVAAEAEVQATAL